MNAPCAAWEGRRALVIMKIILLGPPGSGKGTQAENIRLRLGIPSISTGQLLREAIKEGAEIGLKAKSYIDAGQLVPDEIVVGMVKERTSLPDCQKGYILDGFPRNIAQAEALEEIGVSLDAVISIEVSDEEIVRRMSGRRVCPGCGQTYHTVFNPPEREGVCGACAMELTIRSDDAPETVKERLKAYHAATEPLKGYYERKGKLKTIVSQEEVSKTTQRMMDALGLSV